MNIFKQNLLFWHSCCTSDVKLDSETLYEYDCESYESEYQEQ